jgi:predicted acylesterase/phospholipase RssA
MYLILTCDGGGIRGVITARLISRLDKATGFLKRVDLLSGTSTGSILTLGLAKGLTPEECVELYRELGDKVFSKRDFLDGITHLDELVRANYSNEPLKEALTGVFGDTELRDLETKVVIPAFDLDNQDAESKTIETRVYKARFWKPKYMHNFESEGNDGYLKAADVALRSSSAPTYFPSYQGYVDGGVVDNNPSVAALARAVKDGAWLGRQEALVSKVVDFLKKHPEDEEAKGLLEEIGAAVGRRIALLSLGTGFNPRYIEGDELDWGYKQWLQGGNLLNMLFDGMLGPPDYVCRQLLNGHYRRVNPNLPEVIDLDDVDKLDEMLEIADSFDLTSTVKWLENILEV